MARPKGKEKTVLQLWKENRDILEEAGYTQYTFSQKMESLKKTNNVRTPGAWRIFKHGNDFTDKTIIGAENMVASIKEQGDYNYFRKEVQGWKNKIDYANFSYDKDNNQYIYEKDGNKFRFTLISGSAGSQYWKWTKVA